MKILVACEYSGRVREAFRARGHNAVSCDFEPAEDNSNNHYQGDVFDLIGRQQFDLMIAHPPCTYLCNSGVRWLYAAGNRRDSRVLDQGRMGHAHRAIDFFKKLLNADIPKIAIENPIMHGMARGAIGPASQFVHPYYFGEPAMKSTGLWLKGLPLLVPTNKLTRPKVGTDEHKAWSAIHRTPPGPNRWKIRSRTFQSIADQMAAQWG